MGLIPPSVWRAFKRPIGRREGGERMRLKAMAAVAAALSPLGVVALSVQCTGLAGSLSMAHWFGGY